MKHLILLVFFCLAFLYAFVQNRQGGGSDSAVTTRIDTTSKPAATGDTSKSVRDSVIGKDSAVLNSADQKARIDTTTYHKLLNHPYLPGLNNPIYLIVEERERPSKDELFYLVSALLFFLAFIKLVFPKYFQNIFRLFFQPSFRQKQTREQLLHNNLPSLLYNLFFILAGALYSSLLVQYFRLTTENLFILFLYATAMLGILYFSKYVFLTFAGWVFNAREAAETYIFVVYLINKIIGIVLIPFILVLAFSKEQVIEVSITVSFLVVGLLFLYRYIISYSPVRREIKVSPFHFFFYILAFEVTPLLLIYKVLANYLTGTL